MTTKNANYLTSRIEAKSRLVTTLKSVEGKLSCYPSMSQTGRGSTLRYALNTEDDDHFYSIEIGKSSMAICTHSSQSPLYFMHEALLRLLSMMQLLSEDYEVSANDLLPYLVAVLARQQINHYEHAIDRD